MPDSLEIGDMDLPHRPGLPPELRLCELAVRTLITLSSKIILAHEATAGRESEIAYHSSFSGYHAVPEQLCYRREGTAFWAMRNESS